MNYLNILKVNPLAILFVVFILLTIGVAYWLATRKKRVKVPKATATAATMFGTDHAAEQVPVITIGGGRYKAVVIRDSKRMRRASGINIIDFTSISDEVGARQLSEPSCPLTGVVYTALESPDGAIIDYNEAREMIIDADNVPEMAFKAIVWKEMKEAIGYSESLLRNVHFWLVVAILIILFFVALASIDV